MELGIDPVDNLAEIFLIFFKIKIVNINNQHLTQCVMRSPGFVTLI